MFTDGIQRKSTNFEKVDCNTKATKAEQLKICFDNKITTIQHGLKDDLTKSLTRWLQTTNKSSLTTQDKRSTSIKSNGIKRSKQGNHVTLSRNNSFGFGDKPECGGDKHRQLTLADRLVRVKSLQVNNVESSNSGWVPSLKSLNRSISLRKTSKTSSPLSAASSGGDRLKRSLKLDGSNGNVLFEARQQFKRDISTQVNKYDSWRSGINKGSLSLFVMTSIIVGVIIQSTSVLSAPLPPPVIAPIWLRDGLMNLESSSIENEPDIAPGPRSPGLNIDENQLNQILQRIEDIAERQQQPVPFGSAPEVVPFNGLEESQIGRQLQQQQQQQDDYSLKESLALDGGLNDNNNNNNNNNQGTPLRLDEPKGEELFWIERRRLDRDRSLEPPPWLREQPMRRGFGPIESNSELYLQDRSGIQIGQTSSSFSPSFEPQEVVEWPRLESDERRESLGRKSRQSDDQIYEEIFRHLVEEAHDSRSILDELYDELELRLKANQRHSSMASQQANIVSPSKSNDKQKSQRLTKQGEQNKARNNGEMIGQDLLNAQPEILDTDSTLVVVGDEVSSSDDVTPLEEATNLPSSNILTNSDSSSGSDYGNEQDKIASTSNQSPKNGVPDKSVNTLFAKPVMDSSELSGTSVSGNSDVYFAGPERISNGALLLNVDPASDLDEPLLQQIPISSSFHVIEDIDQTDNSQDSDAHPTFIDNDDSQTQQQRQVLEQTELISSPSEGKRAIFGRDVYMISNSNGPEKSQVESGASAIQEQNGQSTENRQKVETLNSGNKNGLPNDEKDLKPQQQKYLITLNRTRDEYPLAMKLVESGLLTRDQLIWAATKLKYHLESFLGLSKGTILGLYPMNSEQVLIKLDTSKLKSHQVVNMIQNYDYARGFIVTNWPKDSLHSPLPLLSSILRMLASKDGQSDDGSEEEEKEVAPAATPASAPIQQQQSLQLEPVSIIEQPMKPLYNYQQEADDELHPSSNQWSPNYLGQLSVNGGTSNKNKWQQPDYTKFIQLAANTDNNEALQSRYMAQNQRQLALTSLPKPILVNQGAPSGRLSLDYLAAYLDAIDSNNRIAEQELQQEYNGQLLSPTSGLGGSPWSSQAVRNLLTLAAGLGSSGRPLIENLVATSTAYGDEQNKIRHSMLHQKFATTSGQSRFETSSQAPNSHILLHLFALLAAILAAFFAIKIFIHSDDKQQFIRRRLTSSSTGTGDNKTFKPAAKWFWGNYFSSATTTTGEIVEKVGKDGAGLKSANFIRRKHSNNDNCDYTAKVSSKEQKLDLEQGAGKQEEQPVGTAAKNLDLLAHKLVALLNLKQSQPNRVDIEGDQDKTSPTTTKTDGVVSSTQELDEASVGSTDTLVVQSEDGKCTRFRSSRSYIKSLIEALTKAKSQVSSSGGSGRGCRVLDENICGDDDDEDQQATVGLLTKSGKDGSNNSSTDSAVDVEQQQSEAGILTSQMDISAAHLILAYMEKHLEDKERLQREWRELNDNSASFKNNLAASTMPNNQQQQIVSKLANNAKVAQLMMQKLAKCALNDDNRGKNRNCSVVPYDRNRVKLNTPTATVISSKLTKASGLQIGVGVGLGTGTGTIAAPLAQRAKQSDYINASYIYDDDPRRPTHIIAQGPTEQTLGAFWQMVWEQRVSVIVMLTRLNENSVKMCHCYWPTNNTAVNVGAEAVAAAGNSGSAAVSSSKMSSSNTNLTNTDNEPLDNSNGKKKPRQQQQQFASSNSPLLQAGAEAIAYMSASNNTDTSSITATNNTSSNNGTRRSSVTSVFNLCEARASNGGNNLPIIANGDLNNNILCFEIISSPLSSLNSSSLEDEIASSDNGTCKGNKNLAGNENGNGNGKTLTANNHNNNNNRDSKSKTNAALTQEQVANQKATRFEVHLVSEHVSSSDYLVRNMYMINRSTGETRTITQFHYLAWPECGVPDNVKSFLQFRRKVHKSYRNLKSPILVHCSDGAGRSGTYTLIDIILERIKNGAKEIDPRATLEHLRDQRVGLCATQKQFEFVLVALAEEIQIILNALPH